MSFILGAVLFLLGGFLGMLTMAFAQSVSKFVPAQDTQTFLRAVKDD